MEKYLNFQKNYNCKLGFNYFTTIRSLDTIKEKDLKVGDYVNIQVEHFTLYYGAKIVSIEEIDLDNLSRSQKTLLMLDCGCIWELAVKMIEYFCESNKVAVITLVNH